MVNAKRCRSEVWTNINIPGITHNCYQVNSRGRIRDAEGKILIPEKIKDGYLTYTFITDDGKKIYLHRSLRPR